MGALVLSGATVVPRLHWRARHRTVRAKYAAITVKGLEPLTAALAFVEELAGIGGHCLSGPMAAFGTGDRGLRDHGL